MKSVPNTAEFIDPGLIPPGEVRVAAFDGENAGLANGRRMDDGILAYTPWGEIACALAGREGYERVRRSDEQGVAAGAETIAELFGDKPALILLDELSIYLRKIKGKPNARDQLTAFLTSLFKAVESSPRAALVYTLAIGKDGKASDAYSDENQFIADKMAEAESVSARKATLLNPTEDDETVQVLRRRLFEQIDEVAAAQVIEGDEQSYRAYGTGTERPWRPKPENRRPLPISGPAIRFIPTCWRLSLGRRRPWPIFRAFAGCYESLVALFSGFGRPVRPMQRRSISGRHVPLARCNFGVILPGKVGTKWEASSHR